MWHSSLTAAQTKALESLQRRAMRVIFQDNDYTMSLIRAGLETLESRRDQLTECFFQRSDLPETPCLHYLLPDQSRRAVEILESGAPPPDSVATLVNITEPS